MGTPSKKNPHNILRNGYEPRDSAYINYCAENNSLSFNAFPRLLNIDMFRLNQIVKVDIFPLIRERTGLKASEFMIADWEKQIPGTSDTHTIVRLRDQNIAFWQLSSSVGNEKHWQAVHNKIMANVPEFGFATRAEMLAPTVDVQESDGTTIAIPNITILFKCKFAEKLMWLAIERMQDIEDLRRPELADLVPDIRARLHPDHGRKVASSPSKRGAQTKALTIRALYLRKPTEGENDDGPAYEMIKLIDLVPEILRPKDGSSIKPSHLSWNHFATLVREKGFDVGQGYFVWSTGVGQPWLIRSNKTLVAVLTKTHETLRKASNDEWTWQYNQGIEATGSEVFTVDMIDRAEYPGRPLQMISDGRRSFNQRGRLVSSTG